MRTRIKRDIVFTTEDNDRKKRMALRNVVRKPVFVMTVFGKKHRISEEEYKTLLKTGYNVRIE